MLTPIEENVKRQNQTYHFEALVALMPNRAQDEKAH